MFKRELARHALPHGLIRQAVRLTLAGHHLRRADSSIAMVAQAAGFFDSAHFNHAWHLACAVRPSIYRALTKSGCAGAGHC